MVIVMSLQNVKLRDLVSPADSDSLLVITTPLDGLPFKIRDVRTALRDIPQVLAVTAADSQPWTMDIHAATLFPAKDPGSRRVDGYFNLVAEDYIEGIGARLLAGRDFSVARGGDLMPMSLRGVDASFNVIVDRSLALAFGWSPDEAVGREIFRRTNSVPAPFRIIGVIEDRPQHFLGLGSQGNLYGFSPEATSFPVIRLAKGAGSAGLQAIDRALTALAPQTPLQRRFSSDLFDENSDVFLVVAASFGGFGGLRGYDRFAGAVGNGRPCHQPADPGDRHPQDLGRQLWRRPAAVAMGSVAAGAGRRALGLADRLCRGGGLSQSVHPAGVARHRPISDQFGGDPVGGARRGRLAHRRGGPAQSRGYPAL